MIFHSSESLSAATEALTVAETAQNKAVAAKRLSLPAHTLSNFHVDMQDGVALLVGIAIVFYFKNK